MVQCWKQADQLFFLFPPYPSTLGKPRPWCLPTYSIMGRAVPEPGYLCSLLPMLLLGAAHTEGVGGQEEEEGLVTKLWKSKAAALSRPGVRLCARNQNWEYSQAPLSEEAAQQLDTERARAPSSRPAPPAPQVGGAPMTPGAARGSSLCPGVVNTIRAPHQPGTLQTLPRPPQHARGCGCPAHPSPLLRCPPGLGLVRLAALAVQAGARAPVWALTDVPRGVSLCSGAACALA